MFVYKKYTEGVIMTLCLRLGGGQFGQAAADMSLKGWTAVLETNLTGPFLMSTTGLLTQGVPEFPRDPLAPHR